MAYPRLRLSDKTPQRLTDESIIKFGKYSGEKLANVPDSYLRWYYGENKHIPNDPLIVYIKESGIVK